MNKEKEQKKNKCVHTEHCCETCGCKYGDEDCPVIGKVGVCNGY